MFPYKVSIVIPIYNSEEYLHVSIGSLVNQTMDFKDIEVLLINNGSKDGSEELCLSYANKYENIKYFSINEKGVSFARNYGIENATGKYIGFLDSDDALSPDCAEKIYKFFEKHFDETDVVTYKIVPFIDNKRQGVHYRYRYYNKTGIYSLENPDNWYFTQTTINIFVKNKGKGNNILFDVSLVIQEDQKYNMESLMDKKMIGFVKGPEYHYMRHFGSATKSKEHAYYIFEDTMNLWETMFSRFPQGQVPHYIQAVFLHDINWKTISDIWMPYHYEGEKLENALSRIKRLVCQLDDDLIINHPVASGDFKYYLLHLKDSEAKIGKEKNEDTIFVRIQRAKIISDVLQMSIYVYNPLFFFVKDTIKIFVIIDGERKSLEVRSDVHDFFEGMNTGITRYFTRLQINLKEVDKFYFEIEQDGITYKTSAIFSPNTIFGQDKFVNAVFRKDYCIRYKKRNSKFVVSHGRNIKRALLSAGKALSDFVYSRRIKFKSIPNRILYGFTAPKKETWLYLDVEGVFDNAYLQFMHDIKKDDGINRIYCIHESDGGRIDELFKDVPKENIIFFASRQHKMLYLHCKKIITGYCNAGNLCPMGAATLRWYYDLVHFEVVYLQHGVLHASLEDMYSYNKCQVDKVVVSTNFELKNFTSEKYKFNDSDLIKSGMPRYDLIDRNVDKQNKILFAPSWRKNLVGRLINGERECLDEIFLDSKFYKETIAFLNSSELKNILESNDMYLDLKNHPNFECYNHLLKIDNPRVRIVETANVDEYKLFITDYSSMVFDAVYIDCPILYFLPDYDLFKAGVSHTYRKLDLYFEDAFGPLAMNADEIIANIKMLINNGMIPLEPYKSRMDNFFLHYDDKCRDRLYDELMK